MGRVDGKACAVTGAGSGIGKAISERLAQEGGEVLCVDVNDDTVSATVEGIRQAVGVADTMTADVSMTAQ